MAAAMKAMKSAMKKAAAPKAMKAMKAMKAKAAMKSVMKRAMKKKTVSKIARGRMAYALVLRGSKAKTASGLTAGDLVKNKYGKIVSKKKAASGKKNAWAQACQQARKALKVTGFCPIGGKTAQGKALYAKAKALLK